VTEVVLQSGEYRAVFMPLQGMNMVSLKKGEIELIDQSTWPLFEERFAGLGPVIGPHFHRQKDEFLGSGFNEALFPHIARVKANGTKDPFSHGIARYAPWNYSASETKIKATICGNDLWRGCQLKSLEGTDFSMEYIAEIGGNGLNISLNVNCESRPCVAGLHTYYAIGGGTGVISSQIKSEYNDGGAFKPIPDRWYNRAHSHIKLDLNQEIDFGFLPSEGSHGRMLMESASRSLLIGYESINGELSCQVFHPKGASFVCIEPLSAKNPRILDNYSGSVKISIELI